MRELVECQLVAEIALTSRDQEDRQTRRGEMQCPEVRLPKGSHVNRWTSCAGKYQNIPNIPNIPQYPEGFPS
ncbi:hypothetical protein VN97_g5 [Penicillium thymicola]|uniref:Uncharacterized protein n=1 Tax=Penicillium thymicola TaxID=293382 RepID=A0AAI9TW24_PENTH|nr:hypothetical protein VN97_g5 [Penicillium thymicola]